jgi:hypothetical protein
MIKKISWVIGVTIIMIFSDTTAQRKNHYPLPSIEDNLANFNSHVNKLKITPGQWRPMFNSEQICWISPKWGSQEYIYLDFPEAIFIDQQLIYLSHISDRFRAMYNYQLPKVQWKGNDSILYYDRNLGSKIFFGGEVKIENEDSVSLKLWINNLTEDTLKNILLQTCSFLHQIKEFDIKSDSNKFIHTKGKGWITLEDALSNRNSLPADGKFRAGWREGPAVSDIPVIIATSVNKTHFVAMTWFENTYSFIGNAEHPCFHADPFFPDIFPGETKYIHGAIIFYQGNFQEFARNIENWKIIK